MIEGIKVEKIGFVFTEKKIFYKKEGIELDLEMLYISTTPGDTTDKNYQKENGYNGNNM